MTDVRTSAAQSTPDAPVRPSCTSPSNTPSSPPSSTPQTRRDGPALRPPVDVIEDSRGITLLADLPGVGREQLNLRVDGDQLHIEASMSLPMPDGMQPSHAEVQLARYARVFTLSKELDASEINAELNHGVLKVRIPKTQNAQPRRIEVSMQ